MVQRAAVISNLAVSGAGIYCNGSQARFEQCAIAGNSPGLVLSSVTGSLHGCTVANNPGVGVWMDNTTAYISNSILWGSANLLGGNSSPVAVQYSDIQGGYAGAGNINGDPRLYANWHLKSGSPCINAGSPGASGLDVDSEARSGNWDMGCDEFLDSDGDTLPNIVETGTGVKQGDTDMGSNPHSAHSDNDTVSDGDEWIADTDPSNPNAFFQLTRLAQTASFGVTFPCSAARIYSLQACTNLPLSQWFGIAGQTNIPGGVSPMTLTDPGSLRQRSYRVKVAFPQP